MMSVVFLCAHMFMNFSVSVNLKHEFINVIINKLCLQIDTSILYTEPFKYLFFF